MGEHVGPNEFVVRDITIQGVGSIAYFVRGVQQALAGLRRFFSRTNHEYSRFNYLGEWHSHPLFEAEPSSTDHRSMHELIVDHKVGAHFLVLIILKLNDLRELGGSAHTYFPDGSCVRATLQIEGASNE